RRRHRRTHPRPHHRPHPPLPRHRRTPRWSPPPLRTPKNETSRTLNAGSAVSDVSRHHMVELGGIEPPSIRRTPFVLRPFPTSGLTAPRRRVGWPHEEALGSSFRAVSGLSRRQPSFRPSSSASVAGLREIGPVRPCGSRCLSCHLRIRRRERTARWQLLWL